jgi:hypothetical protein
MAGSLADMLVGAGLQTSAQSADLAGASAQGAKIGMELGQTILNAQNQRAQLEKQKKDLSDARMGKFVEAIDKSKSFKDPTARKNYLTKFLPAYRDKLGLTDAFPDESLQFMTSSEENMDRIRTLTNQVYEGKITGEAAQQIANDPIKLAEIQPTSGLFGGKEGESPDLAEAIKFNRDKNTQVRVAELTQSGQNFRQDNTPKIKEEEKVRSDYVKFQNDGGESGAEAKLKKLREAEAYFKEQKDKAKGSTGTIKASVTSRLGLTGIVDPNLKTNIDKLRSAINLKSSLDSQFSAKEAEQQYSQRTVDPDLPAAANYERAKSMREEAEKDLNNSKNLFNKYGLGGPKEGDTKEYQGKVYKVIKGHWVKQ